MIYALLLAKYVFDMIQRIYLLDRCVQTRCDGSAENTYEAAFPHATLRSVKALENDLVVLETKYDQCSEHLAKGESEDFGAAWLVSNQFVTMQTQVRRHLKQVIGTW